VIMYKFIGTSYPTVYNFAIEFLHSAWWYFYGKRKTGRSVMGKYSLCWSLLCMVTLGLFLCIIPGCCL